MANQSSNSVAVGSGRRGGLLVTGPGGVSEQFYTPRGGGGRGGEETLRQSEDFTRQETARLQAEQQARQEAERKAQEESRKAEQQRLQQEQQRQKSRTIGGQVRGAPEGYRSANQILGLPGGVPVSAFFENKKDARRAIREVELVRQQEQKNLENPFSATITDVPGQELAPISRRDITAEVREPRRGFSPFLFGSQQVLGNLLGENKPIESLSKVEDVFVQASRSNIGTGGVRTFFPETETEQQLREGLARGAFPNTPQEVAVTIGSLGTGFIGGSSFNIASRIIGGSKIARATGQIAGGVLGGLYGGNVAYQFISAEGPEAKGRVLGEAGRDLFAFGVGAKAGSKTVDILDFENSFQTRALRGLQDQKTNFIGIETTPPGSNVRTFNFAGGRTGASSRQDILFTAQQYPSGSTIITSGKATTKYVEPSTGSKFESVDFFTGGTTPSARQVTGGGIVSNGKRVNFPENANLQFGTGFLDIPGQRIQKFPVGSISRGSGRVTKQTGLFFDRALVDFSTGGAKVRGKSSGQSIIVTNKQSQTGFDIGSTTDSGFTIIGSGGTASRAMRTLKGPEDFTLTTQVASQVPVARTTQTPTDSSYLFGGSVLFKERSSFAGTGLYERSSGGGSGARPILDNMSLNPINKEPKPGVLSLPIPSQPQTPVPRSRSEETILFGSSFQTPLQPQSPILGQPQVPVQKQPPVSILTPSFGNPPGQRRSPTPFGYDFSFIGPRTGRPRLPRYDLNLGPSKGGSKALGESEFGVGPSFTAITLGLRGRARGKAGSPTLGLELRGLDTGLNTKRKTRKKKRK